MSVVFVQCREMVAKREWFIQFYPELGWNWEE